MGEVWVRGPDGTIGTVPDEDLDRALQEGYSPASAEEVQHEKDLAAHEGLLQGTAAAAEGLAQGVTFGGYGAIAGQVSPEYAESMQLREEANPLLSGGSELVGAVAPALLSGGAAGVASAGRAGAQGALRGSGALLKGAARLSPAGAVARGASRLGSAVSSRAGLAAGLAVEGTIEGGLYGAGMAVSEASLDQDAELTAEKLWAGTSEGMLFGALGGGAFGLAAKGAQTVARAAGRRVLGDDAMRAATRKTEDAVRISAEDAQTLVKEGVPESVVAKAQDNVSDEVIEKAVRDAAPEIADEAVQETLQKVKSVRREPQKMPEVSAKKRRTLQEAAETNLKNEGVPDPVLKAARRGDSPEQIKQQMQEAVNEAVEKAPDEPFAAEVAERVRKTSEDGYPVSQPPRLSKPAIEITTEDIDSVVNDVVSQQTPFEPTPLQQAAKQYADDQILRTIGANASDTRKLGRHGLEEVADQLRVARLKDGTPVYRHGDDVLDVADRLHQARGEVGSELGDLYKQVDELRGEEAIDLRGLIDQIDQQVVMPLQTAMTPAKRKLANKVQKSLTDLYGAAQRGDSLSIQQLHRMKRDIAEEIYPKRAKGSAGVTVAKAHAADLQRANQMLAGFIEEQADAIAQKSGATELVGRHRALREQDRDIIRADDIVKRIESREQAPSGGLGNMLTGNFLTKGQGVGAAIGYGIGGPVGGVIGGLVGDVAKEAVQRRARSVAAELAERVAQTNYRTAASLDRFFSTRKRAPMAKRASSSKPASKRLPAAMVAYGTNAKTRRKKVEQQLQHIQRFNADPQYALQSLTPKMTGLQAAGDAQYSKQMVARIMPQLMVSAQRGAQFLQSKLPPRVRNPGIHNAPLAPLSDSEISRMARYIQAVNNPRSVLGDLEMGALTPEAVEALKATSPKWFTEIQQMAIDRIIRANQAGRPLPHKKVRQISLMLDLVGAPTLSPSFIARSQDNAQAELDARAEATTAPPPSRAPSRIHKAGTPSQRLEM